MGVAEEIARKRAELAGFITASAAAVLSEQMTEAERGVVAVDLLRLMMASGLQAPSAPMIDVTPAPVARVAPPVVRPVAQPTAEALVAALTPPKRRGGNRRTRRFTDEQLLAAIEKHGRDSAAIAEELGVSKAWIIVERRRLGVSAPAGGIPRPGSAKHAVHDWPMVDLRWTDDNVAKLREMAMRMPRTPTADIAREFGTSVNAIQTAMSRFSITRNSGNEPNDLSAMKPRKCMTCQKPFASEGIHNRRCNSCKSNDHRIAA
ncbi:hypothetical protein [Bradyrhizobium sp. WSM1253]|uniref:hypothetical protein n=1 Tax=Bradyrhizobium sp. WSM1253 TaxID=319003 RepID=UPI00025D2E31|nr:hypothetical protein [Bradyrhizobium sp. WSM1253]EIG62906.1 hypothetical protein Bra1253DRAFT_07850 [Bradyrhizobium sp. WSM1253]